MIRPVGRRELILDAGGLDAFAADSIQSRAWLKKRVSAEAAIRIRIPSAVLTEAMTGQRRTDERIRRLLRLVDDPRTPGSFWLNVTPDIAMRAAALRYEAIRRRGGSRRRTISAIDAQVVALAEVRSFEVGVTILTGDVDDLQLLVDVTGRTNIAVVRV